MEDRIFINNAGHYIKKESIQIYSDCVIVQMNNFKLKINIEKFNKGLTMKDIFDGEVIN